MWLIAMLSYLLNLCGSVARSQSQNDHFNELSMVSLGIWNLFVKLSFKSFNAQSKWLQWSLSKAKHLDSLRWNLEMRANTSFPTVGVFSTEIRVLIPFRTLSTLVCHYPYCHLLSSSHTDCYLQYPSNKITITKYGLSLTVTTKIDGW